MPSSAHAVERLSRLTETATGNTAPIPAMFRRGSKAVTAVTEEEFRNEKLYQMCLSVAKEMLRKQVISEKEYAEIDTILLQKYKPSLSGLLSVNSLI